MKLPVVCVTTTVHGTTFVPVRNFRVDHPALPGEVIGVCVKCGRRASIGVTARGVTRATHLQVWWGRDQYVTEDACYWTGATDA